MFLWSLQLSASEGHSTRKCRMGLSYNWGWKLTPKLQHPLRGFQGVLGDPLKICPVGWCSVQNMGRFLSSLETEISKGFANPALNSDSGERKSGNLGG